VKGVQVALTPFEEEVMNSTSFEDMILACDDMLSQSLVLTRAIERRKSHPLLLF